MFNQRNAEVIELVKTHKRIIKLLKKGIFSSLANSCVLYLFTYLIENVNLFNFFTNFNCSLEQVLILKPERKSHFVSPCLLK